MADQCDVIVGGGGPAARAVNPGHRFHSCHPPINGLRDNQTWDIRDATSAKEVPGRLVVLGGGAAEEEMAPAWHRLGGFEVTVVEAAERLLTREEPFTGDMACGFLGLRTPRRTGG